MPSLSSSSYHPPSNLCFHPTLPVTASDDESVDMISTKSPSMRRISKIFDRFSNHAGKEPINYTRSSFDKAPQKSLVSRMIPQLPKRSSKMFSFPKNLNKLSLTLKLSTTSTITLTDSSPQCESHPSQSPQPSPESLHTPGTQKFGQFAAFDGRRKTPSPPRPSYSPYKISARTPPKVGLGISLANDLGNDIHHDIEHVIVSPSSYPDDAHNNSETQSSPGSTNTIFSSRKTHQHSPSLSSANSAVHTDHEKTSCTNTAVGEDLLQADRTIQLPDLMGVPIEEKGDFHFGNPVPAARHNGDYSRENSQQSKDSPESQVIERFLLTDKSLAYELDVSSSILERCFFKDSASVCSDFSSGIRTSGISSTRFSYLNQTTDTFPSAPSTASGPLSAACSNTVRVKAFCQDIITAPEMKSKGVFAIIVSKKKIRSAADFADAIARKITSRYGDISADRVGLLIFFKGRDLKPIVLKQPGAPAKHDELMLDIILDYITSREKLYLRTFL